MRLSIVLALVLGFSGSIATAAPLPQAQVPAALKPWIGWALYGHDELACPSEADGETRLCRWPSTLQLDLDARGGRFTLIARTFAPGWIVLPGQNSAWPQDVSLDGKPAAVLTHDDEPVTYAAVGEHRIEGRFEWPELPESLHTPDDTGLLTLAVSGSVHPSPRRDGDGNIALGRVTSGTPAVDNHVDVQVYRRLEDGIPVRLTTHLDIDAAGEVREQVLGPVLPTGFAALSIDGDLPARIDAEGRLHLQLRPGRWKIDLAARADGNPKTIERPATAAPWPETEVWSFAARRELRVVDVAGGTPVDPRQTQMPTAWTGNPAFSLQPGESLSLEEKQRGLADAPPDSLQLQRDLWLDFDGDGYTLHDRLRGSLQRTWRLDATAPLKLGQVRINGVPQLITQPMAGSDVAGGVEVRNAALDLMADARIDTAARRLSVSGWNVDLQGVNLQLHLPPAWRLWAAPGADNVPETWLARWTLLDLFIVLIAAVATLRLFGPVTAVLALLTLALSWHETAAPHWSWIVLIALIALVRALPASLAGGQLRRWLVRLHWTSAAVVMLMAVPFFIQQARLTLYPQLESEFGDSNGGLVAVDSINERYAPTAPVATVAPASRAAPEAEDTATGTMVPAPPPPPKLEPSPIRSRLNVSTSGASTMKTAQMADPSALTQTGPGLPQRAGYVVSLSWNGPVTMDQTYRLWLSPPWLTRLLRVLTMILIAALLWRWLELRRPPRPPTDPRAPTVTAVLVAIVAIALFPHAAQAQGHTATDAAVADAPSPPSTAVLDELRQRLTAGPDCAPSCASISRLRVGVSGDRLTLRLSVDADAAATLPLPVPLQTSAENGAVWQPESVLTDGHPSTLRRADDGALWTYVPAGRHELLISGSLAGFSQLQLPLPLKPRQVQAEISAWQLSGLDEQGLPDEALQLAREPRGGEAHSDDLAAEQTFSPLLIVTRTVHLGLDWSVDTQVTRSGSTHTALVTTVPLLAGEAVTGDTVKVQNGAAQLSFAPNETEVSWSARLPATPTLNLIAPKTHYEIWQFDVGPVWHVDFDGLVPVQRIQRNQWLPVFQPWPDEKLTLAISRPAGAPGRTLTLQHAALDLVPGRRATDAAVDLTLQSSQGGQHRLPLPEGASLLGMTIDGAAQPGRLEGGALVLPLHPGEQHIQVQLRFDRGLSTWLATPPMSIGLPGVNAEVSIQLPPDRWVLLAGGPQLGPAVLFWGVLAVLLLIAFGLSRLPLTPLGKRQWLLLSVGLSQIPVAGAAVVVAWLFALGVRGRIAEDRFGRGWLTERPRWRFNTLQVSLVILSLVALGLLASAIAQGLLGAPDMQVVGNGSSSHSLNWFSDRFADTLPNAWVLSISIWWYRLLMLLWALWLANALLRWLRWGWAQLAAGGLWHGKPTVVAAPAEPQPPPPV